MIGSGGARRSLPFLGRYFVISQGSVRVSSTFPLTIPRMRLLRLTIIFFVILKYGLDDFLTGHERFRAVRPMARALTFWRDTSAPRAVRLRLALEDLGPIFVKFGQMLSTRRDLIPLDIADELAKLQDGVPPFSSDEVIAMLTRVYGRPVEDVFKSFDRAPVASASVAQVHFAVLPDGTEVAVKVLRPNIKQVIDKDISLLHTAAMLVEKLWSDGKRLRPRAVVAEFEKTLADELDLSREAANCSQLRRNFRNSPLLLVPAVHWDWSNSEVMVMERMAGIPIGQVDRLVAAGVISSVSGVPASSFFSRRCSATAISMPTCTRETSSWRPTAPTSASTSRWTSGSWARCRSATRAISRRTSSRSSAATTTALLPRTSSRVGCRPAPASMNSRRRSALC
jgi:hypothetical protein